jgi:hypothetical protein
MKTRIKTHIMTRIKRNKYIRKNKSIKSRKRKSRKNKKKKYHGGFFDIGDLLEFDKRFFDYDITKYKFNTFEFMIECLTEFIKNPIHYELYYKDSILDLLLKNTPISELPHIIQLILKLEIKPANAIYYINDKLGYDAKKKTTGSFLDKIYEIDKIQKLIDTNRNEHMVGSIDGWMILSQIVDLLIKILNDIQNNLGIQFTDENDDLFEVLVGIIGVENTDIIKKIMQYIKLIISDDAFIECGLLKYLLNETDTSETDTDELSPFEKLYEKIIPSALPLKKRMTKEIKSIEDFFNPSINTEGIMPPFILVLLSCRINPAINDPAKKNTMDPYRKTIISYMNKFKFCCSPCCFDTCVDCNKHKDTIPVLAGPNQTLATTRAIATTCDTDISTQKLTTILSILNIITRSNINKDMCPSLCGNNVVAWNTFDPIFKLFTNKRDMVVFNDASQRFLFDTIIPYSTFIPLNVNAYFNEVVYRNQDPLFDKKIDFFERRVLAAYENNEYTDPTCVPNKIMDKIYEEWKKEKKETKRTSTKKNSRLTRFFKSLRRTKKNSRNSLAEESESEYYSAREEEV